MRFSRLRLNGFKSFVDPTDLIIAGGLTGVVGPNGCGKSNLLEALRWVMGENRPTAMRGAGMDDVIFGGTTTRPARNFAEVSLTIDNEERLAPTGFNEDDQISIVRRITREAGSAYKFNGKDVRARDVSILFADASTGAHSPALVRQGQISELINAKPKSRRRILEEAAGISGLYQRRHEAELKLKSAETNLARVDDVLEQLSSQLSTLKRQAKQAARYREIGRDLRFAESMLLYLRWRDAGATKHAAEAALREALSDLAKAEARARDAVALRLDREEALPALREEEAIAAAIVQRLQVERDTIKSDAQRAESAIAAQSKRLDQIEKDRSREVSLNEDATGMIDRLRSQLSELQAADIGHDDRLAEAETQLELAQNVLAQREAELAELTERSATLAARVQSVERRKQEVAQAVARNENEAKAAFEALGKTKDLLEQTARAVDLSSAAREKAALRVEEAEARLVSTEAERAICQDEEAEARSARSEAEGRLKTMEAEASALRRLLERESGSVRELVDEVSAAPGFEAALGAALLDDLRAPRAMEVDQSGWRELENYEETRPLPSAAEPLSRHVEVPQLLARRMSQVGLVNASEGAALQASLGPGQRLVSREGDLWRWDGFCLRAQDASSSATRRLEQRNRLDHLESETARLTQDAQSASRAHQAAADKLRALAEADEAARRERREADRVLAEASRAASKAESEASLLASKVEAHELAAKRHQEAADAARDELARAQAALAELDDLDEVRRNLDDLRMTVEASRVTMMTRRAEMDEIRRAGDARRQRREQVTREIETWTTRLGSADARLAELEARQRETAASLERAKKRPSEIAEKRAAVATELEAAERRKNAAAEALSVGESNQRAATAAEREAERAASEARETRAAAAARDEAAAEAVDASAARIFEELEVTAEVLIESLGDLPEPLPKADQVEADVTRLRRQRDALGAVNLRSEEDAREVETELETLRGEKTDLEAAIAKLRTGISGLNKEGRARLLKAFDEVNQNFGRLFTHLFGGGEARLMLVESDDPLEAGLEILCQPPGKKLSTLSLLSGGEQTLTALALIFGVFLANPAPICVLDEVDAPLDDANVTRFCDLLDEMTRQTDTRFLIITHHAVTMARMDRLFGVTMGEQGVSQLVSVDLQKAEKLVA